MDNKEQKLDDMLADYTDAILEGQEARGDADLQGLDGVIKNLYRAIDPQTPPSPAFRARLTQRLHDEWAKAQRERRMLRFARQRWIRIAAAAAVLIMVVGVVLLLPNVSDSQEGTTSGETPTLVIVAGVGLVAGLAAVYYWWSRRRG